VTIRNVAFWDVTPCGSGKNRRFGGTYRLHHQGGKNQRARNTVSSKQQLSRLRRNFLFYTCSLLQLLVIANVRNASILVTLMMEALLSSETSMIIRATRRHIAEDGILYACEILQANEEYVKPS
jgi:hypothetical protein